MGSTKKKKEFIVVIQEAIVSHISIHELSIQAVAGWQPVSDWGHKTIYMYKTRKKDH